MIARVIAAIVAAVAARGAVYLCAGRLELAAVDSIASIGGIAQTLQPALRRRWRCQDGWCGMGPAPVEDKEPDFPGLGGGF